MSYQLNYRDTTRLPRTSTWEQWEGKTFLQKAETLEHTPAGCGLPSALMWLWHRQRRKERDREEGRGSVGGDELDINLTIRTVRTSLLLETDLTVGANILIIIWV